MTRIYLALLALLFVGYGLACLASPSILADQTGMQLTTGVASAEVRAMYGGLQTACGMLALLAFLREGFRPGVLLCLGVLLFGLASGRLVGIAVDADPGTYNYAAFVFEALSAAAAFWLLSKESQPAPA